MVFLHVSRVERVRKDLGGAEACEERCDLLKHTWQILKLLITLKLKITLELS